MAQATTRRSALRSIAMAATAPAIVTTAWAAPGPRTTARIHQDLSRAIALHGRAEATEGDFYENIEKPAHAKYAAALKAYPVEPPPPHEEVATVFLNLDEDEVRLSTAAVGSRAIGERVTNDPTWADMGSEEWRQAHRELYAAHVRRDAIIAGQTQRFERFKREASARFRIAAINDRSNTLSNRRYGIYVLIIKMPVATIGDLATKVAFIERHEDDPNDFEIEAVFADVKWIATREGGRA